MPAAREALITAPHGRYDEDVSARVRSDRSCRTTPSDRLQRLRYARCIRRYRHVGEAGNVGGTRGAVISASPPTPPRSSSPSCGTANAGRTRGADHSASWPAESDDTCTRKNRVRPQPLTHAEQSRFTTRVAPITTHQVRRTRGDTGSNRGAIISASPPEPPSSPSCCVAARPATREALITAPHSRRGGQPPAVQAAQDSWDSRHSSLGAAASPEAL